MAKRFGPLLGTWTGLERHEATAVAPATTARASMVLKLGVDDTVVLQDYRQVRADGSELTGHGVFLVEPGTDHLLWWFFDSSARVPVPAAGQGRDGELLLVGTTSRGSTRHRFHARADRLEYQIAVQAGAGAELQPWLSGSYGRLSGH